MAQLTDIRSLRTDLALILTGYGWTVDKLATADIKQLTSYAGISDMTAQRIIGEARQLVNVQGYQDALAADNWRYQGSSGAPEPPKYSVRVQRIMERKARGEL